MKALDCAASLAMPVALNQKVAHVIRDFRAVHQLVESIDYELEKRIVARLGLIKIEALQSIIGAYKNEIKRTTTAPPATIQDLEGRIRTLTKDVETGIREARNANIGHSLALPIERIPDHWLFMGRSSFSILEQDLQEIEKILSALDNSYQPATQLPVLDAGLIQSWSEPTALGAKGVIRGAFVYAGPWTPDIVALLPGNTAFQDASIRVLGLRLMLRQIGILSLPFWLAGGPVGLWEKLLLELALIDYFSLEETVFDGNSRGGTPSLLDEWSSTNPAHVGVVPLRSGRATLSPDRLKWKSDIRDKVCAHMDLDVSASLLAVANWPILLPDFHAEVERLCRMIGSAARLDIRTHWLIGPALSIPEAQQLAGPIAPRWADT
jgi:hypothetical protein